MILMQGDCLKLMQSIPDGSVDMVLCDLPYGITQNKWDSVIPFEPLWEQYRRVAKANAAIVLFSCQPFTSALIMSNPKEFKQELIWKKTQKTGFYNAHKQHLRIHENIIVFYRKPPCYNPKMQNTERKVQIGRVRRNMREDNVCGVSFGNVSKGAAQNYRYVETGIRYPTDVLEFSNWNGALFGNTDKATKHPTQKPVPLLEYLIKTYTNDGETVLDNCMGSGSTGVACANTGREFVGIEKDPDYFVIAQRRIVKRLEEIAEHGTAETENACIVAAKPEEFHDPFDLETLMNLPKEAT